MKLIAAKKNGTLQRYYKLIDRIDLMLIDLCVAAGYVELADQTLTTQGA
jgi:hypothetical protein